MSFHNPYPRGRCFAADDVPDNEFFPFTIAGQPDHHLATEDGATDNESNSSQCDLAACADGHDKAIGGHEADLNENAESEPKAIYALREQERTNEFSNLGNMAVKQELNESTQGELKDSNALRQQELPGESSNLGLVMVKREQSVEPRDFSNVFGQQEQHRECDAEQSPESSAPENRAEQSLESIAELKAEIDVFGQQEQHRECDAEQSLESSAPENKAEQSPESIAELKAEIEEKNRKIDVQAKIIAALKVAGGSPNKEVDMDSSESDEKPKEDSKKQRVEAKAEAKAEHRKAVNKEIKKQKELKKVVKKEIKKEKELKQVVKKEKVKVEVEPITHSLFSYPTLQRKRRKRRKRRRRNEEEEEEEEALQDPLAFVRQVILEWKTVTTVTKDGIEEHRMREQQVDELIPSLPLPQEQRDLLICARRQMAADFRASVPGSWRGYLPAMLEICGGDKQEMHKIRKNLREQVSVATLKASMEVKGDKAESSASSSWGRKVLWRCPFPGCEAPNRVIYCDDSHGLQKKGRHFRNKCHLYLATLHEADASRDPCEGSAGSAADASGCEKIGRQKAFAWVQPRQKVKAAVSSGVRRRRGRPARRTDKDQLDAERVVNLKHKLVELDLPIYGTKEQLWQRLSQVEVAKEPVVAKNVSREEAASEAAAAEPLSLAAADAAAAVAAAGTDAVDVDELDPATPERNLNSQDEIGWNLPDWKGIDKRSLGMIRKRRNASPPKVIKPRKNCSDRSNSQKLACAVPEAVVPHDTAAPVSAAAAAPAGQSLVCLTAAAPKDALADCTAELAPAAAAAPAQDSAAQSLVPLTTAPEAATADGATADGAAASTIAAAPLPAPAAQPMVTARGRKRRRRTVASDDD